MKLTFLRLRITALTLILTVVIWLTYVLHNQSAYNRIRQCGLRVSEGYSKEFGYCISGTADASKEKEQHNDSNVNKDSKMPIASDLNMTKRIYEGITTKILTTLKDNNTVRIQVENPSIYLRSDRFDVIVKIVYAYFYAYGNKMPSAIEAAYLEHLKVWNNFSEKCDIIKKEWFDAKRLCEKKGTGLDFLKSFRNTIDSIRNSGFNSSMSRIPIDVSGFPMNGAHRLAASIVLSKNATFDHHNDDGHFQWDYKFFKSIGLSNRVFDMIIMEWMKIQLQLPCLETKVSIVSVFSNNHDKDETMRKIVKENCSYDNDILYERTLHLTRSGARQLITHIYGKQPWLEAKIKQMLSKFLSNSMVEVLFLFIYGKDDKELVVCKNDIRKVYNDKIFKSTVHIPDTVEENLILAEMILNPNSVQFLNYAGDPADCERIAKELARRSAAKPIKTLPDIYLGRDDIMIDSGAVLGFFGLRNRTDVDILFLQDIDKSIIGNKNGLNVQAHAFKLNSVSKERPWGEDHFNETGPKDQWDMFYDPKFYGYCYGMKFVSLEQIIRYKKKRNEPNKDKHDVRLVEDFLKRLKLGSPK